MFDKTDPTIATIMILFPLAAGMVVFQANPYYALVTRGILGAVAAMIYALLGAADVALTEALVGTMLSITLYAVAVRSSLVMRLGVLADQCSEAPKKSPNSEAAPLSICDPVHQAHFAEIVAAYRQVIAPYHLRLELVPYDDIPELKSALAQREVHGICMPTGAAIPQAFETLIRVPRLFALFQASISPTLIHHTCLKLTPTPVEAAESTIPTMEKTR